MYSTTWSSRPFSPYGFTPANRNYFGGYATPARSANPYGGPNNGFGMNPSAFDPMNFAFGGNPYGATFPPNNTGFNPYASVPNTSNIGNPFVTGAPAIPSTTTPTTTPTTPTTPAAPAPLVNFSITDLETYMGANKFSLADVKKKVNELNKKVSADPNDKASEQESKFWILMRNFMEQAPGVKSIDIALVKDIASTNAKDNGLTENDVIGYVNDSNNTNLLPTDMHTPDAINALYGDEDLMKLDDLRNKLSSLEKQKKDEGDSAEISSQINLAKWLLENNGERFNLISQIKDGTPGKVSRDELLAAGQLSAKDAFDPNSGLDSLTDKDIKGIERQIKLRDITGPSVDLVDGLFETLAKDGKLTFEALQGLSESDIMLDGTKYSADQVKRAKKTLIDNYGLLANEDGVITQKNLDKAFNGSTRLDIDTLNAVLSSKKIADVNVGMLNFALDKISEADLNNPQKLIELAKKTETEAKHQRDFNRGNTFLGKRGHEKDERAAKVADAMEDYAAALRFLAMNGAAIAQANDGTKVTKDMVAKLYESQGKMIQLNGIDIRGLEKGLNGDTECWKDGVYGIGGYDIVNTDAISKFYQEQLTAAKERIEKEQEALE